MYYVFAIVFIVILLLFAILCFQRHQPESTTTPLIIEPKRPLNVLHKYVDSIIIICLPQRHDYVKDFCNNMGIHPIIFKAIDKHTIHTKDIDITTNAKLNLGEKACYLSHLQVWKHIEKQGGNVLILEDDVMVTKYINKIDQIMIQAKNLQWDLLYLGRCWDLCQRNMPISNDLVSTKFPGCTHAYIVTPKSCTKLISLMSKMQNTLDRSIKFLAKQNILTCIASSHNMFVQNRKLIRSELGHVNEVLYKCIDIKNSEPS